VSIDNPIYGIRIHDRLTDDDPSLGTVMQSFDDASGPWHDMVTGDVDHIYDVHDALMFRSQHCDEPMRSAVICLADGTQALIEVWSDGQCHFAQRRTSTDTWADIQWLYLDMEQKSGHD
jgi:hypothetical protein